MVKKYLTTRYNCGERERERVSIQQGRGYYGLIVSPIESGVRDI